MESIKDSVIIIGGKTEKRRGHKVTVIISGGVSGLFAALKLAENNHKDVTVLEVRIFNIQWRQINTNEMRL